MYDDTAVPATTSSYWGVNTYVLEPTDIINYYTIQRNTKYLPGVIALGTAVYYSKYNTTTYS